MFASTFRTIIVTLMTMVFSSSLYAAEFNTDEDGVLIHGYDPVSFFEGEPVKGSPAYTHEADGYTLHFSSDASRSRFMTNEEMYTPKFGGYCAYGVRMGKKFDIDPDAYVVHEGRLYMLLDRSTQKLWAQDKPRNIGIANRLWENIRTASPRDLNDG